MSELSASDNTPVPTESFATPVARRKRKTSLAMSTTATNKPLHQVINMTELPPTSDSGVSSAMPSPLTVSTNIPLPNKGSDSEPSDREGFPGRASRRPSQVGYIKTIQRRGNTYMVRDSLPSEEDPAEMDSTQRMSEDLYAEAIRMSTKASRLSSLYKTLYVLVNLLVIVAGVAITIISIPGRNYPSMVLGALISGAQTFMSTFSIEKRGVLLRDLTNKLRHVSRQVKSLQMSDLKPKEKLREIDKLYAEVDELDLSIYDNNITANKAAIPSNIIPDRPKRDGSDLGSGSGDDMWYEPRSIKKLPGRDQKSAVTPVRSGDLRVLEQMRTQQTK
jgi:hypothetical protein